MGCVRQCQVVGPEYGRCQVAGRAALQHTALTLSTYGMVVTQLLHLALSFLVQKPWPLVHCCWSTQPLSKMFCVATRQTPAQNRPPLGFQSATGNTGAVRGVLDYIYVIGTRTTHSLMSQCLFACEHTNRCSKYRKCNFSDMPSRRDVYGILRHMNVHLFRSHVAVSIFPALFYRYFQWAKI